jgi:hypothetical protein
MAIGVLALVAILGAACSSDTEDAPAAAQPTTAASTEDSTTATTVTAAATAVPTAASSAATAVAATPATSATTAPEATAEPEEVAAPISYTARPLSDPVASCTTGMSIDEQKAVLIDIGVQLFDGVTAHDGEIERLHYDPDARDRRQGGVWVVIEYNGDEADGVARKKAGIEAQMSDAYDAFFNSGCDELTQVDIGARMVATGAGVIGPMAQTLAVVYKTRMKREQADGVDWANKDSVDFNQVWDELLLNTRWRNELRGD